MSKVRIGFIGAGYIAGVHRSSLAADDRVEITAVYDTELTRGGSLAVPGLSELLDRVDAVYITAPNTSHARLALECIEAGRHVFCEKPLATSMEDARQVLTAARQSKSVFQVGFNRRFAKVYKRLREVILARPARCAHVKMNRGELLKPSWTADRSVTGGFLFETPIHMFDMMRFQFGEVAAVTARQSRTDDFSLLVEFASGLHATFVTSAHASWYFPYERLEVFGEYCTVETLEMERIAYRLDLAAETISEDFSAYPMEERFGFAEEDRLFVDAVLGHREPAVTALDGYRAVELASATYESARLGCRVEIPMLP
ncbi:MAG: Gfo/Idh/MocA family oxidoreductase [Acidobacteria bacterium]|nr:Gfo/Idh/MocA family oxidoreductase [Acidobacteriota bacterium]